MNNTIIEFRAFNFVKQRKSLRLLWKNKMDKINRNILHILQSEGRISFSELAKRVHLSAPAVAERVKRLEEESVITGYTATIDSHNMGLPITAMVQARVFIGKEPQILAFMKERLEVVEGYNVTGERAFIMKVATDSMKALDGFLEDLSIMAESNTMMILSSVTRKPLTI